MQSVNDALVSSLQLADGERVVANRSTHPQHSSGRRLAVSGRPTAAQHTASRHALRSHGAPRRALSEIVLAYDYVITMPLVGPSAQGVSSAHALQRFNDVSSGLDTAFRYGGTHARALQPWTSAVL